MLIITSEEDTNIEEYMETIKKNYRASIGRDITTPRIFDTNTGISYGTTIDDEAREKMSSTYFYNYSISIFRSKIPESILGQYMMLNLITSEQHGNDLYKAVKECFEKIFSSIYKMFLKRHTHEESYALTNSFIFGCNLVLLNNINITLEHEEPPPAYSIEALAPMTPDTYVKEIDAGNRLEVVLPAKAGTERDTIKDNEGEETNIYNIFNFLNIFIMKDFEGYKNRIDKARQEAQELRAAEQDHTRLLDLAKFPAFIISAQTIREQNSTAKKIVDSINKFKLKSPDSFDITRVHLFLSELSTSFLLLTQAYGIKKSMPEGVQDMVNILSNTETPPLHKITSMIEVASSRLLIENKIRSTATESVYRSIAAIPKIHLSRINDILEKQKRAAALRNKPRRHRVFLKSC